MYRLLIVLGFLFLCSCSQTKDFLGMGNNEPLDEFSVVKTPKLEIPPDFELRPPLEKGQKNDKQIDKTDEKKVVTSKGEAKLLEKIENNNTDYKPTKNDDKFLDKIGN